MKRFALIGLLGLAGCGDNGSMAYVSPSKCTDYRTVTYFSHDMTWLHWYGPVTRNLCVVREQKISASDDSNK